MNEVKTMVFHILVDATSDKPYIKKSTKDGSLAFYDTPEEANKAQAYNGDKTKVMNAEYVKFRDYEELKAENERLKELLTPSCSGDNGNAVNDTGWFINDWLTARGEINGSQFNHLKEMFCEAVKFYESRAKG